MSFQLCYVHTFTCIQDCLRRLYTYVLLLEILMGVGVFVISCVKIIYLHVANTHTV
jgi:hypothetical protein